MVFMVAGGNVDFTTRMLHCCRPTAMPNGQGLQQPFTQRVDTRTPTESIERKGSGGDW